MPPVFFPVFRRRLIGGFRNVMIHFPAAGERPAMQKLLVGIPHTAIHILIHVSNAVIDALGGAFGIFPWGGQSLTCSCLPCRGRLRPYGSRYATCLRSLFLTCSRKVYHRFLLFCPLLILLLQGNFYLFDDRLVFWRSFPDEGI